MFSKGNPVVHPSHGAGRIIDISTMAIDGNDHSYYHIELIDGSGMLMIPVDYADEVGLRPVADADAIAEVLSEEPVELNDNYRTRQAGIAKKISSGDAVKIAEALRDLFWRGELKKLSGGDTKLKVKARTLLATEIAAQRGLADVDVAAEHLTNLLRRAAQSQQATPSAS